MTNEKENYIWDLFCSLAEESVSLSDNLYIDTTKTKETFFIIYEAYKEKVRSLDPKFFILDRHKLAAVLYCTVIKFDYIKLKNSSDCTFFDETHDKQLAFFLCLNVLSIFVSQEEDYNLPLSIKLPSTKDGLPYIVHLIRSINDYSKLDYDNEKFDIDFLLLISHIFFFIENKSIKRNIGRRLFKSLILFVMTFVPILYIFLNGYSIPIKVLFFVIWLGGNIVGSISIWKIKLLQRNE